MSWVYEQASGRLSKDGILVAADCYSGQGEGFNNPQLENVVDVGPIPAGWWTIQGPPYDDPKLGEYVLRLIPDPETALYGRDGESFRWHGKPLPPRDIHSGSDGCICSDRDTRRRVYQSGDVRLQVIPGAAADVFDPEITT